VAVIVAVCAVVMLGLSDAAVTKVTVGGIGLTVTVADAVALPPAPVHFIP
jgi:hypothetical protein